MLLYIKHLYHCISFSCFPHFTLVYFLHKAYFSFCSPYMWKCVSECVWFVSCSRSKIQRTSILSPLSICIKTLYIIKMHTCAMFQLLFFLQLLLFLLCLFVRLFCSWVVGYFVLIHFTIMHSILVRSVVVWLVLALDLVAYVWVSEWLYNVYMSMLLSFALIHNFFSNYLYMVGFDYKNSSLFFRLIQLLMICTHLSCHSDSILVVVCINFSLHSGHKLSAFDSSHFCLFFMHSACSFISDSDCDSGSNSPHTPLICLFHLCSASANINNYI